MNSSPARGSFQREGIVRRAEQGETSTEHAEEMLQLFVSMDEARARREADPAWQENNLEYDLRSTEWICVKVKQSEKYAQNLYAALCNNEFRRNEVWPQLKNENWSCSWRYAGGIVADMREKGDYIDWYCSGIRGNMDDEQFNSLSVQEREQYLYGKNNFVSESVVTDEIREDLFRLGWLILESENND